MIKVAILDDYQNAFMEIVDVNKLRDKFNFKVFNQAFNDENEVIEALEEFEALFIMRERTPITKNLLDNLPNLKYIMTSGMRNNSINLEITKKKGILVCGTEINSNPAAEITWTLILGLLRNIKQEIDNMFQGYWQTTIGSELKGKMLGVIGLGKIGTQVAKVGKAFGMEVCAWSENLNLSHANEHIIHHNVSIDNDPYKTQYEMWIISIHFELADALHKPQSLFPTELVKKYQAVWSTHQHILGMNSLKKNK